MKPFVETIAELLASGYTEANVEEKLAQDIMLKALSQCGLKAQVTVKGGVVMATLTRDIRRTTMDLDIDLIRHSLSDESIDEMIRKMNCIDGVTIVRVGDIVELKQQDYSGKRVFVSIRDTAGYAVQYKLDIGAHTVEAARQEDMEFDLTHIGFGSATLLANAPEQVFVEKLKSLLRLGTISSRGKDIFDMVYLASVVDENVLKRLMDAYIYSDKRMFERNIADVVRRLKRVFSDRGFMAMLANPRMNWLKISPVEATRRLVAFMKTLA